MKIYINNQEIEIEKREFIGYSEIVKLGGGNPNVQYNMTVYGEYISQDLEFPDLCIYDEIVYPYCLTWVHEGFHFNFEQK